MNFLLILIASFFLIFQSAAIADTDVRLLNVHDGDTVTVTTKSGKKYKIRLFGIDAPELSQEYGEKSRRYLQMLLTGKKLSYKSKGDDNYGRKVAILFANGKNINLQMIKDGFAWHYKQYAKSVEFANAQKYAKNNKLGLWSQNDPIAPWAYRNKGNSQQNANNEPLFQSPIDGLIICFNVKTGKISLRTDSCPRGHIIVME